MMMSTLNSKPLRIFAAFVLAVFAGTLFPARSQAKHAAVFAQINLYANIETIGVYVSGSGLPGNAQLFYRQAGASELPNPFPFAPDLLDYS